MNESWNGESTLSSISSTTVFPISSTPSPHRKAKGENSVIGFVSVLTACVMSGFAGIYFEKILKVRTSGLYCSMCARGANCSIKGSSVSIWVRNFQLAGPSIVFSLLFAFGKDNSVWNIWRNLLLSIVFIPADLQGRI